MQTPREILDERLARGEIDEDEHTRLLSRVTFESARRPPPLPPPLPPIAPLAISANASRPSTTLGIVVGVTLAVLGMLVLAEVIGIGLAARDGLNLGNIATDGPKVSFTLANSSTKSGDVVVWIEQGKIEMCEYLARVEANSVHHARFFCSPLKAGKFTLFSKWADFDSAKAAVAQRIEIN